MSNLNNLNITFSERLPPPVEHCNEVLSLPKINQFHRFCSREFISIKKSQISGLSTPPWCNKPSRKRNKSSKPEILSKYLFSISTFVIATDRRLWHFHSLRVSFCDRDEKLGRPSKRFTNYFFIVCLRFFFAFHFSYLFNVFFYWFCSFGAIISVSVSLVLTNWFNKIRKNHNWFSPEQLHNRVRKRKPSGGGVICPTVGWYSRGKLNSF